MAASSAVWVAEIVFYLKNILLDARFSAERMEFA
jgi:hypothetical protein